MKFKKKLLNGIHGGLNERKKKYFHKICLIIPSWNMNKIRKLYRAPRFSYPWFLFFIRGIRKTN